MATLESLIQQLHEQVDYNKWGTCTEITQGADDCPDCCGEQYFNGNLINYQCEQKRRIYALRYLPVHIYENYKGALLIPEEQRERIFNKVTLNILSIGGGPGSDIAGFKKFIDLYTPEECLCMNFTFIRLDNEDGWNDISKHVIHLYGGAERKFDHKKVVMDACLNSNWFDGKRFDIILISYLISELQNEQISTLANNLKKCMSEEALLVINDRNEVVVHQKIQLLSSSAGIILMASEGLTQWANFSYDENIKSQAKPKLSASSKVRVFKKVPNDN